ncbi:hypothetical protein G3I71_42205 [Streptomyces sp. SID12501]|uniref:Uncharacterized protein n=1 Tax=Streptomyces sp. SID12501 TaxID=2706042 RepID=A0A6B3C7Z1_9ACTN|nr:hypothetical protein [Streptomyces sp. SID12501]
MVEPGALELQLMVFSAWAAWGDAMDRLVHHELRASLAALLAVVVSAVVVGLVRGFPSVRIGDRLASSIAALLAFWVLIELLKATRIKWFGEVRDFDAATPVDPETVLPIEDFWHDRPVGLGLLPMMLVPTLVLALFWEPWMCLMPLLWGLEMAAKAARVAHWERKNGRVLWRGRVVSQPWELSWSPVGPRTPARTATEAPPS